MQYYLIQKVRWLFNSFLTKMFNRSTNVALAGNDTAKGARLRYTFKLAQTVCRVAF